MGGVIFLSPLYYALLSGDRCGRPSFGKVAVPRARGISAARRIPVGAIKRALALDVRCGMSVSP